MKKPKWLTRPRVRSPKEREQEVQEYRYANEDMAREDVEAADGYLERAIKYIPTEIVAAHTFAMATLVPTNDATIIAAWCVFALLLVGSPFWIRIVATLEGKRPPRLQVFIAPVVYLAWAYSSGYPFTYAAGVSHNPEIGATVLAFIAIFTPAIDEIRVKSGTSR